MLEDGCIFISKQLLVSNKQSESFTMGQSATLYRIAKSDFAKIIENPYDFGLFKITKGYTIFEKTFDGLQFVLAKGLDEVNKALIEFIFYPKTFIGEEIDFSKINFEDLPADFDFERQPVYYNEPNKVSEIADLLNTISLEKFQQNFDHAELNKQDIYPGGIWNDRTEENAAFNVRDMSIEFQNLTSIFNTAKENSEYLLSYVG
jgi:Domain of unknown function (DUF1877)